MTAETIPTRKTLAGASQLLPLPAGGDCDTVLGGPQARPKRRVGTYDCPNDEKRAYGLRMRLAREIAGITQTAAATSLGYSQPVQLSVMESGHRLPTLRVLVHCTKLYGTTMDYLCGFSADSDPDPAACATLMVAARVTADVRRLIGTMTQGCVDTVRALRPDAARMERMAALVVEADAALRRVRSLNPTFDEDARGAATLVQRLHAAADLAGEHLTDCERARRRTAAGPLDFAAVALAQTDHAEAANEDISVAVDALPLRGLSAKQLEDEPHDDEAANDHLTATMNEVAHVECR